jgi:hypothetical protein
MRSLEQQTMGTENRSLPFDLACVKVNLMVDIDRQGHRLR